MVTAIGLAHAALISLIGLVLIAPAYVEDGRKVHTLWTTTHDKRHWAVLVLATAWCFTAGIFSQILWDDWPITAPLAHLRWQCGR